MRMRLDPKFHDEITRLAQRLDKLKASGTEKAVEIITVVTDKVLDETVKRVPVDESFLEQSITKKIDRGESAKEIVGTVFIPANSPAAKYAWYMHELTYNLGKRSQVKQAGSKVVVGRKYMQRALEENARAIGLYIVKKLREFFA